MFVGLDEENKGGEDMRLGSGRVEGVDGMRDRVGLEDTGWVVGDVGRGR